MSTLPVTVVPSSSVQYASNEIQQIMKGISSLPEDRIEIFLRLFGVGQPPARDRRLQKFVKEVLPDLLQSGPTALSVTLSAILDALGRASAEDLQLFREPRIPAVFQRAQAYRPEFRFLAPVGDKFDLTFPTRTRDLVVLASFVALPQFHAMPGSITVDGIEVTGTTYGEDQLYYMLRNDGSQKLFVRAAPRQPDTPIWLIIHYVTARQSFITEFCQRHELPCARPSKVLCQHKSCPGEWLELAGVVTGVIQTGSLRCPHCGTTIGWEDLVLQGDRAGGMKTTAAPPAPPPPRAAPSRSAREVPPAIAENLEYAQAPVREESIEEQELRRTLSIILCTRLKGPPEKSNITELLGREFDLTEERFVEEYREPDTTDGFLDAIEAIDPY
jgi:hypothetical protein